MVNSIKTTSGFGIPVVLFFSILTIYYETLQPSVPGGDAGELITEAYQLGLPHPPGYPLHSILGYFASHSPFSVDGISTARDVNFLSSILGAFAGVFIYTTILLALPHEDSLLLHFSAIIGSFGYCVSPLVWTYSITAEVFALNNFFASLIVCMIVYVVNTTERGSRQAQSYCIFGSFVCGLGLTNQHSLIFFILPIGLIALWWCTTIVVAKAENKDDDEEENQDVDELPRSTFILRCCLAGCVGFSLYFFYLPYATGKRGSWGDGTTIIGFLKHILRYEYGKHPCFFFFFYKKITQRYLLLY
jgi:hypothetical protein